MHSRALGRIGWCRKGPLDDDYGRQRAWSRIVPANSKHRSNMYKQGSLLGMRLQYRENMRSGIQAKHHHEAVLALIPEAGSAPRVPGGGRTASETSVGPTWPAGNDERREHMPRPGCAEVIQHSRDGRWAARRRRHQTPFPEAAEAIVSVRSTTTTTTAARQRAEASVRLWRNGAEGRH